MIGPHEDEHGCEQFRLHLDRWADGDRIPDGEVELEAHAAHCEICAQELALYRRLRAEREAVTEAIVPAGWAREMADRMTEMLEDRSVPSPPPERASLRPGGLLGPRWAWAAVVAVLILTNGIMVARLQRLETRQETLLEALASSSVRGGAAGRSPRAAAPADQRRGGVLQVTGAGGFGWNGPRVFGSEPTVGSLRQSLEVLAPGATLLEAEDAAMWRRLLDRGGFLKRFPFIGEIEWRDGLQAGEAAALLERVPLRDDWRIDMDEWSEWLHRPDAYVDL